METIRYQSEGAGYNVEVLIIVRATITNRKSHSLHLPSEVSLMCIRSGAEQTVPVVKRACAYGENDPYSVKFSRVYGPLSGLEA